jgi:hypothetical protein
MALRFQLKAVDIRSACGKKYMPIFHGSSPNTAQGTAIKANSQDRYKIVTTSMTIDHDALLAQFPPHRICRNDTAYDRPDEG